MHGQNAGDKTLRLVTTSDNDYHNSCTMYSRCYCAQNDTRVTIPGGKDSLA
jgi:hypothetical protein